MNPYGAAEQPWQKVTVLEHDTIHGLKLERVAQDEFGYFYRVTEQDAPYCWKWTEEAARWDYEGRLKYLVGAARFRRAKEIRKRKGPKCAHGVCSQNYIDTGETRCIHDEPDTDCSCPEHACRFCVTAAQYRPGARCELHR